MAIQEITSPPLLDSTGQTMVTKLQSIASALSVNASGVDYDNTVSGLTATKVQSAIDEVKGITDSLNNGLAQLDYAKKACLHITLTSSSPATVRFKSAYMSFMIMGMVQGLGSAVIVGKAEAGTVTAKDALTGNNWTSTHLVLSASSNVLTISSDNANLTDLTVVIGNVQGT